MKSALALLVVSLALIGALQAQPYAMLSTGSANYSSPTIGSQTKRRDTLGVGYALNERVAVEASIFQIQEATYTPDLPTLPGQTTYTVQAREKKSGFAVGPVFRWKVLDQITVYTKQSFASIRTDAATVLNTGATTNWSYADWGYQPSIGAQLRAAKDSPVGLGVELSFLLTNRNRIKRLTTLGLNLSYGF
ncbi:MAG TPA: outer membrane beta-barrel protein [Opitutaceae bacterium]|nr:outer membrane beta-barrel protein [Opitutaceae bacterium]